MGWYNAEDETAALTFAAAAREEYTQPRHVAAWFHANRARVELLLTFATTATTTCDPDLALALLLAAWRAIGNVGASASEIDPATTLPRLEQHEIELCRAVRAQAVRLLAKFSEDCFDDNAVHSNEGQVRGLVAYFDRHFAIYRQSVT